MQRFTRLAVVLSLWLAPAIAFADPPPSDTVGSSPEPMAWLLLAMGVVPALYLYLKTRRTEAAPIEA